MAAATMTFNDWAPQQQLITQSGGNVIIQDNNKHRAIRFKKVFMGLGITQLTIGVLCLVLGLVAKTSLAWDYGYNGYGLFGGGWYIVCGALAVATGAKPNNCNVIGGMVVSILASLVAFGAIWYEGTLVFVDQAILCGFNTGMCEGRPFIAIHGTIACLAFVEFVVAIVHSSYCCCGTGNCCGNGTQDTVVTTTTVMAVPNMPPQLPMHPQGYAYAQGYPQATFHPQQTTPAQGISNPTFSHYEGQQQHTSPPPSYEQQEQKQAI